MLRVATYNIKHGALKGLPAVADAIRGATADLVAIQEVDVGTTRSGGVDQARLLSEAVRLEGRFVPAFAYQGGAYGMLLLSRFPIGSGRRFGLPSASDVPLPSGAEPRILCTHEVSLPDGVLGGGTLQVAMTHLGLEREERLEQAEAVLSHLRGARRTLLVGDLNEGPGGAAFARLRESFADCVEDAGLAERRTFPAGAPSVAIDHVLRTPDLPRATSAAVLATDASDHLPLVVELP